MAYVKTIVSTGDIITATLMNDIQTQYDEAKADIDAHTSRTDNPHAVTAAQVGAVNKAGDTMTGALYLPSVDIGNNANGAIELGKKDGTTSTPFIDFHSGATVVDYDSRIIAGGGTGVTGGGTIDIKAANVTINANKVWHAGNDGAGSGLDADTVDGKHASDFMNKTKIYGYATYTDTLSSEQTLIKTIPLGGIYAHGKLTMKASVFGILVNFSTNPDTTLVTGTIKYYTDPHGGSWSKRNLGTVSNSTYGYSASGNSSINVNNIYINETDLVIEFKNTTTSSPSLNARIDWEVW